MLFAMNETDDAGDGTTLRLSREEIDQLADDIAVLAAPPPEAAQTTERRGGPSAAHAYSPLR